MTYKNLYLMHWRYVWRACVLVLCCLYATHSRAETWNSESGLSTTQLDSIHQKVRQGDTSGQAVLQSSMLAAKAIGDPVVESKSMLLLALVYKNKGQIPLARKWLTKCIELRNSIHDKAGLASAYNNLGILEFDAGRLDLSAQWAEKALAIRTELGDKKGMASSFSNIGNLYEVQGLLQRAYDCHKKSVELYTAVKDSAGIAGASSNLANLASMLGKNEEALRYHNQAKLLFKKLGNEQGLAMCLNNMSYVLQDMGRWQEALDNALLALNLKRKLKDLQGEVYSLMAVSELFQKKGNLQVSGVYLKEAYEKAKAINHKQLVNRVTEQLSRQYALEGNHSMAYKMLRQYTLMNDSMSAANSVQELARLENQYELELQQTRISALENEKLEAKEEAERREQDVLTTRILLGVTILVLVLVTVFALYFLQSRQKTQQLNAELRLRSAQLEQQNQLINEKNKSITDSIEYARQLQNSMYTDLTQLQALTLNVSVYNQPRDIVGGDFVWSYVDDQGGLLVVADCVGHGVRGSMLTMFGQALLTELVSGSLDMNPAELLQAIDTKLCQQFHDAEGMPTGQMELAIVQVAAGASSVKFASARMPVYVATSQGVEMLKSGQVSLGNPMVKFKEYPVLELPLVPGQLYFICSDGVADQFGGPEGKKLTRNRLREYLKAATMEFSNPQLALTLVKENVLEWQGNSTQTDDILVVAFGTTLDT